VPTVLLQRVADYMGATVKRFLVRGQPRTDGVDWEAEYEIRGDELDAALDLIAVCRHRKPLQ
jgi:hypothetical protein